MFKYFYEIMNSIKSKFSIKDLENLSGIKAHTIRIWEKRYGLFNPNRTDTNIRYYSVESLQKILNIAYLNNNGYKISKIAKLDEATISTKVSELAQEANSNNHYVDLFKLSMLNFDQSLFTKIYREIASKHPFEYLFYHIIVPFLDEIGLLWQTNTITPAHEHFIVELVKQKILLNIERILENKEDSKLSKAYVIFLPDNEVHELGVLYSNYEILKQGHHTLYLGQSVPINSMLPFLNLYNEITFITCFTVHPEKDLLESYLNEFQNKLLKDTSNQLLISGRLTAFIEKEDCDQIKSFKTTKEALNYINSNH